MVNPEEQTAQTRIKEVNNGVCADLSGLVNDSLTFPDRGGVYQVLTTHSRLVLEVRQSLARALPRIFRSGSI